MEFSHSSRARLNPRILARFGGDTLFDRIARVLCAADCVPRKELYEAWEVARRARRRFRGGRVLDLACGHGLVAHLMLLLDDSSSEALAVDTRLPSSAAKVHACLTREWPRLQGRVKHLESNLRGVTARAGDVIVSAHACGRLTDEVIDLALHARARVAVLPCCHSTHRCDRGGLDGWVDAALAIDVTRAARLRNAGFHVYTQTIPAEITPKNRLLLAAPA